jgi:uncharacterized protein
MLRRTAIGGGIGRNILDRVADFVQKNIPDPRNDPSTKRLAGYESFKATGGMHSVEGEPGETLDVYLKKRNEDWAKKHVPSPALIREAGLTTRADGSLFQAGDTTERAQYATVDSQNKEIDRIKTEMSTVDEEKVKLRRQLQMENEEEFRKFMAESRRQELNDQATAKRRMPHPTDPKYDPFKITPGYRPQDSSKLASWLQRQRASGQAHSGASLNGKEGQERFYNEEKMATQFHANPFSHRVEVPSGLPKIEISAISPDSFFISDQEVIGSIICTPTRVYHWNASTFEDINKRTLSLLLHLYPVPDILFIGTGRNLYHIDEDLRIEFMKRGTVVHSLTTKDATSVFGLQLSLKRRVCCAALACVPTNGFGKECFGDFVENDAYCLSDTALGIRAPRQFNPYLYRSNKVAEKYRHMQGTGFGPRYKQLPDGRLVRPGTSGTKLRPMLEPGETPDWEKLPSYYNWFPKERLEDYVENTTYREMETKSRRLVSEDTRLQHIMKGEQPINRDTEQPQAELMPWDSATIPLPKWQFERNEGREHLVNDPKTGRLVGMNKKTFDAWRSMMKAREEGKEPEQEVEYDQERYVSDRRGRIQDTSKARYIPLSEAKWHPHRAESSGKQNHRF